MAVHPLRPATDHCLGGPLPLQLANQTQTPLPAIAYSVAIFSSKGHAAFRSYSVLAAVSSCCPHPEGRLFTRYSPVCHSIPKEASFSCPLVRLACVKHAASVRPEPGSNSPWYMKSHLARSYCFWFILTLVDVLMFSRPRTLAFNSIIALFSFQRSCRLATTCLFYQTHESLSSTSFRRTSSLFILLTIHILSYCAFEKDDFVILPPVFSFVKRFQQIHRT